MIRFILLGIFFFVALVTTGLAQATDSVSTAQPKSYYLVLYKPGRANRFSFYAGQNITFKLLNDKKYYSGKINAVHKDTFVFWDTEIPLSRVDKIRLENHTLMLKVVKAGSNFLREAGKLFAIVGTVNFLALPKHRQDGLITASAGLSAYTLGQGGKLLQKRSYKINKNHVLKTRETYY